MSYLQQIEYRIIPKESFKIIRNCAGCGCKAQYHNTNCFRVNANGNKIDVWLIYQCTKCKHTYNLTIHERCRPELISSLDYEGYLANSNKLAFQYGTDSSFFVRNRAEIDWSDIKYDLNRENSKFDGAGQAFKKGDFISVCNGAALKIRTEKVVSEILGLSRSGMKELEISGIIAVTEEKREHRITIVIEEEISCERTI